MIKVGDLVRIKNKHLRADNIIGPFVRTRRKDWKKFRGSQRIARVLKVLWERYDWKAKAFNQVVELDIPDKYTGRNQLVSTHWLILHKRHRVRTSESLTP